MNVLRQELILLARSLGEKGISLIVAGGFGLVLRETEVDAGPNPVFEVTPEPRTTGDIDLILPPGIIADLESWSAVRDTLRFLNWTPVPGLENLRWEKLGVSAEGGVPRLDLMAPVPDDLSGIKIDSVRMRPKSVKGLHARPKPEARGIMLDLIPVSLEDDAGIVTVNIPSSFNFLILKLHAFSDYAEGKSKVSDENKRLGQHHAFDIFRVILQMGRDDREAAARHYDEHKDEEYVRSAVQIRQQYFSEAFSLGVIRLRGTRAYQERAEEFDRGLEEFLSFLGELLP